MRQPSRVPRRHWRGERRIQDTRSAPRILFAGFTDVDGDTLSVAGLSADHGTVTDNGNGTYAVTPTANYNGPVSLTYTVTDGKGGSTAATQSFGLVAVNDAPALTGTKATLTAGTEGTAYAVSAANLLAGFTDADGDTMGISGLSADHGSVTDNGDGTFTINPEANFDGTVALSYSVTDGKGGSTDATQSFNLGAVNQAPALTGTKATLTAGTEDTAYSVSAANLLAGFTDADGDTLSLSGLSANHGTVTDNGNGTFKVTPTANYNGPVSLTYTVTDGKGGNTAATQSFILDAVNDAPALTGTKATLAAGTEDTAYVVSLANLLTGFTDADGDTLSVTSLGADHGTVTDNGNGTFKVTPTANYNGAVNLNYSVTDGKGGSTAATQSFNLDAVNDAPALTGTKATLTAGTENTAYTVSAINLLTGFTDADGDTMGVSGLSADHGTVTDNGNGTFAINPEANYNGTVALSYSVADGKGGSTAATQSFGLGAVNQAPALTGTKATLTAGTEDTAYAISATNLLAGFTDADGDTLGVIGLSADHGTVTDNGNGTFKVTPAANYNGPVNLSYTVTDGKGGSTAATQSFSLDAVNDAPALTGTKATLAAGSEDTAYIVSAANLLAGFTDADGDTISISGLSSDHGTVTDNGNGTFKVTPTTNYNGPVNLTTPSLTARAAARRQRKSSPSLRSTMLPLSAGAAVAPPHRSVLPRTARR